MKDSLLIQPAKPAVSNTNSRETQQARSADMRKIPERRDENDDYATPGKKDDFFKQFEKSQNQIQHAPSTDDTSMDKAKKDVGALTGEILNADIIIEAENPKSPPTESLGLSTIKGAKDTSLEATLTEFNTSQSGSILDNLTVLETTQQSETQAFLEREVSFFNYDLQSLTAEEAAQIAAIENLQETSGLADRVAFGSAENLPATDSNALNPTKSPLADITEVASFLDTIKGQIPTQASGVTYDNNAGETLPDTEGLFPIEGLDEFTAELESLDLDAINIDDIEIDMGDLQFQRQLLNNGPVVQTALESLMANNLNMGLTINSEASTLRPMATITMPPSTPGSATVNATAIVNTVAQAILTAKETPQGVMVRLDPPEMGRVLIDFNFENDSQVNVVVKADNVDSHQLLRDRSEHFLQMLQDNGFENVNLSFEQQSFDGSNQNSDNDNRPQSVVYYDAPIVEKLDPQNQAEIRRQINQGKLRLDLKL